MENRNRVVIGERHGVCIYGHKGKIYGICNLNIVEIPAVLWENPSDCMKYATGYFFEHLRSKRDYLVQLLSDAQHVYNELDASMREYQDELTGTKKIRKMVDDL